MTLKHKGALYLTKAEVLEQVAYAYGRTPHINTIENWRKSGLLVARLRCEDLPHCKLHPKANLYHIDDLDRVIKLIARHNNTDFYLPEMVSFINDGVGVHCTEVMLRHVIKRHNIKHWIDPLARKHAIRIPRSQLKPVVDHLRHGVHSEKSRTQRSAVFNALYNELRQTMTQAQIADHIGVAASTLSRSINGNAAPSRKTIAALEALVKTG